MRRLAAVLTSACLTVAMLCSATPAYASWSAKSSVVQASEYGPDEGETITATGKRIGYTQKYVAVPMDRVVSKAYWKKLSKEAKYRYFYYGERLKLHCGKRSSVVTVQDCGGFSGYGGTYKGKWRPRLFDCTPGAQKALGFSGLAFVSFRYETGR